MEEEEVVYKIPNQIIQEFCQVALNNKDTRGHIETLGLITGVWSGKDLIAKELIFPQQKGSASYVEDLGNNMFFYYYSHIIYCTQGIDHIMFYIPLLF